VPKEDESMSPILTPINRLRRLILDSVPSGWLGFLRKWKIKRGIKTYRCHSVKHSYGGYELQVQLEDGLGAGWYDQDWEPLPEIEFLSTQRLRSGSVVFDLGAHQGIVAMMLAKKTGADGKVIAVEANPHNARLSKLNATNNQLEQITVLHSAVADSFGTITFNEGLNGRIDDGTGSWGKVTVPSVTIDQLADTYGIPDVVFIDIEGAEFMALAGAKKVLSKEVDFFVEVHVGVGLEILGGSVEKVLSFFPEQEFERFVRVECDKQFRLLLPNDSIFQNRFFLIAIRKKPG